MDAFFLRIYHKLPRPFQYWISRIKYKPKLGKGVTLYGWSTFSQNVSIGDYSYMKQNYFFHWEILLYWRRSRCGIE